MAAYKIVKLGSQFDLVKQKLAQMIEEKVDWQPATPRTPGAVWFDVSSIIDREVVDVLEKALGRPLHDIFWMTDYRDCKSLEIHRDNPGNEYPIRTIFTLIFMLEGTFKLSIWNDENTELVDSVIVSPGEFIVLNNCQYYHSGEVIDGKKVSLHAYPVVQEIDHRDVFAGEKFQAEDYL